MKIAGLYDNIRYTCEKYRSEVSSPEEEKEVISDLEKHITDRISDMNEAFNDIYQLKDRKVAQLESEIKQLRSEPPHLSIVMSSRLRREIEILRKNDLYSSRDKSIIITYLESWQSAISCEEISET